MRQPCRRGDTTQGTSTDGAYWWLHAKPLNSAIGRVLAPYRPGGCHGHRRRGWSKHNTKHNFYRTFYLAKVVPFDTRNEPSTHVIDATSFVKMCQQEKKEEAISYISSYQTLTADKNSKLFKLVRSSKKSGRRYATIAVNLLTRIQL